MGDTERQEDSAQRSGIRTKADGSVWIAFPRGEAKHLALAASGTVVGRGSDGVRDRSIVAVDDARMSRRHAQIRRNASGWVLEDLGSRNGGFVDGRTVPPGSSIALQDGSVVRLGNSVLVFRDSSVHGEEPDATHVFPGTSPAACAVRERLQRLARTSGHVLVVGETGSGKERLARSLAGGRPVVEVNCAELKRDLARGELFGHVRGAFSGAVDARVGLVGLATNGVLFLDEIGELGLEVQGDLLRFLEDGSYRTLGSNEVRTSSARVVGATNVDLDAAVIAGGFRRDLLARLRAFNPPLEVPPLRERREDILMWADIFVSEVARIESGDLWTAGAVECLLLYPWPGNLRELRGTVRGMAEARAWPVEASGLPSPITEHRVSLRQGGTPPAVEIGEPTEEAVRDALVRADGRMRVAAELLGIDRRKLYRLCAKLAIEIDSFRKGE